MYPTSCDSPQLLELHSGIQHIAATPGLSAENCISRLTDCGTKYLNPELAELAFPTDEEFTEKGTNSSTGKNLLISHLFISPERHWQVAKIALKKGAVIALHDHPQMTGVLFTIQGKLRLESFDLVDSSKEQMRKVDDTVLEAGSNSYLTPTFRNIHRVTALADSIFVDLFVPGYKHSERWGTWFEIEPGGSPELFSILAHWQRLPILPTAALQPNR